MFQRFAEALARRRALLDEIKADRSPSTFLDALS